jgi:hypothetical protein
MAGASAPKVIGGWTTPAILPSYLGPPARKRGVGSVRSSQIRMRVSGLWAIAATGCLWWVALPDPGSTALQEQRIRYPVPTNREGPNTQTRPG